MLDFAAEKIRHEHTKAPTPAPSMSTPPKRLTNEEVLAALLVHSLVDGAVLLSIDGGSGTHAVQRIQADLHAERAVHGLESLLALHEIEIPKDDGAAFLHLVLDVGGIVLEVLELGFGVGGVESEVLGGDCGGEFRCGRGAVGGLHIADVANGLTPGGFGGEGRGLQDRRRGQGGAGSSRMLGYRRNRRGYKGVGRRGGDGKCQSKSGDAELGHFLLLSSDLYK